LHLVPVFIGQQKSQKEIKKHFKQKIINLTFKWSSHGILCQKWTSRKTTQRLLDRRGIYLSAFIS